MPTVGLVVFGRAQRIYRALLNPRSEAAADHSKPLACETNGSRIGRCVSVFLVKKEGDRPVPPIQTRTIARIEPPETLPISPLP